MLIIGMRNLFNMKSYVGFLFGTMLAAMSVAGCNKPAENSSSQPGVHEGRHLNDSDVNKGVKSALLQDVTLGGFEIAVVTTKGDVKLTGVVDNQGQIDHMVNLVAGIKGVHTIHNHVSIKQ